MVRTEKLNAQSSAPQLRAIANTLHSLKPAFIYESIEDIINYLRQAAVYASHQGLYKIDEKIKKLETADILKIQEHFTHNGFTVDAHTASETTTITLSWGRT